MNGWITSDSPWSNAGAALDPEDEDLPAWRRAAAEIRPFTRQPPPFGEVRPSGTSRGLAAAPPDPFGPQTGSGFEASAEIRPLTEVGRADAGDSGDSGEVRVPLAPRSDNAGSSWSSGPNRFFDLLASPPATAGPAAAEQDEVHESRPDPLVPGAPRPATQRPDTLGSADEQRALGAPSPSSAPPFPYEGDLDDARREASRPPVAPHRGSVPLSRIFPAVRPAAPGGRRVDWIGAESARHAVDPGAPADSPGSAGEQPLTGETSGARAAYDPATFPRRLPYEPTSPAGPETGDPEPGYQETGDPETGYHETGDPESGYEATGDPDPGYQESAFQKIGYPNTDHPGTGLSGTSVSGAGHPGIGHREPPAYSGALPGESGSGALPQRVPAEPDVPTVPEPPLVEPPAETPALARIATHLRRGNLLPASERQEGFDVQAILAAVQEVEGVRDASLRTTPQGAHSLRLDLAEGADPADVSRQVARLLQDRMGLDAAMQGTLPPTPPPATGSAAVPFVPTQPIPTGRASVIPAARPPAQQPVSAPSADVPPVSPAGPAYVAGPSTTAGTTDSALPDAECGPARPLALGDRPGLRVVIENVQVNTFGTEATVEVRLAVGGQVAAGTATGPAVDGYLLRLCATATAHAVDELLSGTDHAAGPARCFVEHAASVPFGPLQVAVVVLLLSCGTWVEQLAGSAVVTGDDRHAVVRATLAAVNRRLEALLS